MTHRPIDDDFDESRMFPGLPQHPAAAMSPQAAMRNLPPQQFPMHHVAAAPQQFQQAPAPAPVANGNPLAGYFRLPGLHVTLPTNGAFLPPGAIELTAAGDVPVLPMRAADELLLKNPDALMSGYAIEKLIESCVPAIKAPRHVSTPDLDVILLAIRAATYGEMMSLSADCPSCGAENEFDCHIPSILSSMRTIPAENPVRLSDEVVVYVRPHTVDAATRLALASYDEARKLQALEAEGDKVTVEQRTQHMSQAMERVTRLNLDMLASCVVKIVTPAAEVAARGYIAEFLANTPKPWVEKIETKVRELDDGGIDKKLTVRCRSCSHEWQTEVEFNPASFFDAGSSG